jgi:hypothetical protein
MGANVKECKKPNETLVAATISKAKTYVFARLIIRDREVGGSNPLAPTIIFCKRMNGCTGSRFVFHSTHLLNHATA